MIPISSQLKAWLAAPANALSTCWKVTRIVDSAVYGFTDHDADIVISGVTYRAATGYTRSDVASQLDLAVDNLEIDGMLVSPAITPTDLDSGLWDGAKIEVFMVNPEDLTMGTLPLRSGTLGEVTLGRGTFKAEMRGMTQAYTRVLGELTTPTCRASLGDARCKVDLTPFTVTGTLTGVSSDGTTVYDSARTEPGPTGGVAITGITNANPGVVTTATPLGLTNGSPVTIAGVVGPTLLNAITLIRSPSGNTFQLPIDTSDTARYPPYVSGGTVTPLGSDTGYFDYGVITFTSGANNGRSMEVKAYVPGQITLVQPLPFAPQVGDAYTMHAGCDRSLNTCINRFNNVLNNRSEPYLPGLDAILQVGKQGKSS